MNISSNMMCLKTKQNSNLNFLALIFSQLFPKSLW